MQPAKQTEVVTTEAPAEKPKLTPQAPLLTGKVGLELKTIEEYYKFAAYACRAGVGTKGMTPEEGVIRIQFGAELGMGPARAIGSIMVVNGRPSIWGDDMLALCMQNERFDHDAFHEELAGDVDKGTAVATCTVARIGRKNPTVRSFSIADAKKAGLWDKDIWAKYPKRMLQMRARAFALRDTFADVLRGLYTTEEAQDVAIERLISQIDVGDKQETIKAAIQEAKQPPPLAVEQLERHEEPEPPPEINVEELKQRITAATKSIFPDSIQRRSALAKHVCGSSLAEASIEQLLRGAAVLEAVAERLANADERPADTVLAEWVTEAATEGVSA